MATWAPMVVAEGTDDASSPGVQHADECNYDAMFGEGNWTHISDGVPVSVDDGSLSPDFEFWGETIWLAPEPFPEPFTIDSHSTTSGGALSMSDPALNYIDPVNFYDLPFANIPQASEFGIAPANIGSPTLARVTATGVSSSSATLHSQVTNIGGRTITLHGFLIRADDEPEEQERMVANMLGANPFSRTVTGLRPGVRYHVRAYALYAGSDGWIFSPAPHFTFTTLTTELFPPGVPFLTSVTPGNRSVRVQWNAPANNGGSPILRYEVSVNNGSWTTADSFSEHTFRNLTNGTTYTLRVRAVNAIGAGQPASVPATPAGLPSVEIFPVSEADVTSTSVTLTGRLVDEGGSEITMLGFWIRRLADVGANPLEFEAPLSWTFTRTIGGLEPDTAYVARAIARNQAGGPTMQGMSSEIHFRTAPAGPARPGAPTITNTEAGNGTVTITWTPPINDGGSPITHYEVSSNNGAANSWVRAETNTNHTFRGLTNGVEHVFRVRAVNAIGEGVMSALARETPVAPVITEVTVTLHGNGGVFGAQSQMAGFSFDDEIDEYDIEATYVGIEPMSLSPVIVVQRPVGTEAIDLPRATRDDGYTHVAWATDSESRNIVTRLQAAHHEGDLYAVWQQSPVIESFGIDQETGMAALFVRELITVWRTIPDVRDMHLMEREPVTPTITWQAVPGATYRITLINITNNNELIMDRQIVNGTSYTIPEGFRRLGHTYWVEVTAATPDNMWVSHYQTTFVLREQPLPGLSVTVRDPGNLPLLGARVQLVRYNGRSYFAFTDHHGVAFFPDLSTNSFVYGINVTHPQFVSTESHSRRITYARPSTGTAVRNESFAFSEFSSYFRSFDWADVVENRAMLPYRIGSVFGWRDTRVIWHSGIDFNFPEAGAVNGRGVNSAFEGQVTWIFNNHETAGHGATVRFRDSEGRMDYYMRYMHFIELPHVHRDGRWRDMTMRDTLRRGERFGRIGNTGNSSGAHLHIDVHRVPLGTTVGIFERRNQMDPHAFFEPDFVTPWRVLSR